MSWRVARSLLTMRDQFDRAFPGRDKSSDGTIGDASHQATASDHNPNSAGVVTAMDISHDPANKVDTYKIADALLKTRDPRIKYIISNSRIGGDENYGRRNNQTPWEWHPYHGVNPHDHHMHVSVNYPLGDKDTSLWKLPFDDRIKQMAPSESPDWKSGRGSWYSQFQGKYSWVDKNDKPNSNKLGVPDWAQGISFYNQATLGEWFEVQYPNGHVSYEQQTDIGPNPNTGRTIDISAAAAERARYNPDNFPTDELIYWKPTSAPEEVANLPPKEQATAYYKLRGGIVPKTEPEQPAESEDLPDLGTPKSFEEAFSIFRKEQGKWIDWLHNQVSAPAASDELSKLFDEIKPVLMKNLAQLYPIISQLPITTQAKLFRLGLTGGLSLTSMEVPMDSTKGWLQSKTIWGIIMMLAPQIAQLLGFNLSSADVGNAGQLIQAIIEAAGGLLAIYGRATAKTDISASPIVKN